MSVTNATIRKEFLLIQEKSVVVRIFSSLRYQQLAHPKSLEKEKD